VRIPHGVGVQRLSGGHQARVGNRILGSCYASAGFLPENNRPRPDDPEATRLSSTSGRCRRCSTHLQVLRQRSPGERVLPPCRCRTSVPLQDTQTSLVQHTCYGGGTRCCDAATSPTPAVAHWPISGALRAQRERPSLYTLTPQARHCHAGSLFVTQHPPRTIRPSSSWRCISSSPTGSP